MGAQQGAGSIAGGKWVAGRLRAQPLALPVLQVSDRMGLGLAQIAFQRVLLGRLVEEMGCALAQGLGDGLNEGHNDKPDQADVY